MQPALLLLASVLVMCASSSNAQSPKLMIFGGNDHNIYLGCLNCSEYAPDSVHNQYGQHGSPYSSLSIFNAYGTYGSAYSSDSACSQYATDPPVIVDQNGGFYGRLTLNQRHPQASKNQQIVQWLRGVGCANR